MHAGLSSVYTLRLAPTMLAFSAVNNYFVFRCTGRVNAPSLHTLCVHQLLCYQLCPLCHWRLYVFINSCVISSVHCTIGKGGYNRWTGLDCMDSPKSCPELVPRLKLQYHWCALIRIIVRHVSKKALGKAKKST